MKTVWRDGDTQKSVVAPVSLIVSAFAPVADVRRTLTPQLATARGKPGCYGSISARAAPGWVLPSSPQVHGQLGDDPPDLDRPELLKGFAAALRAARQRDLLLAYHDVSDGGVFATLTEMAFAGHCGIEVALPVGVQGFAAALFAEEAGAVIQVRAADLPTIFNMFSARASRPACTTSGRRHRRCSCAQRRWRQPRAGLGGSAPRLERDLAPHAAAARRPCEHARGIHGAARRRGSGPAPATGLRSAIRYRRAVSEPWCAATGSGAARAGRDSQVEMAAVLELAGFEAHDIHMSDLAVGGGEPCGNSVASSPAAASPTVTCSARARAGPSPSCSTRARARNSRAFSSALTPSRWACATAAR